MTTQVSKKQYITTYLFLIKKAKSEDIADILKFIKNSDVKETTKLNYLNSIIGLKKHDGKLVKGNTADIVLYRDILGTKVDKDRKKDNLNENQKKVFEKISGTDIEDVITKLEQDKNTDAKALEEYVLLKLMYPRPLRNDLADIKICKNKGMLKQQNCIYLPTKKDSKATISIVEHKTTSRGGDPIKREVDADLTNDIRKLTKNRTYLFENGKGNPYSSSAFSHKLSNLFKKHLEIPFSSTMMRKLYHTSKYKDTLDEMAEDGRQMGHSSNTIQKVYVKNT